MTEGIGIDRVTLNFEEAQIDGAINVKDDTECVEMAYHLKKHDGISIGPSAALNVVGAVKLAKKLGPGKTIVTVLCDAGHRYNSKLYNKTWLAEKNLVPKYTEGNDSLDLKWIS